MQNWKELCNDHDNIESYELNSNDLNILLSMVACHSGFSWLKNKKESLLDFWKNGKLFGLRMKQNSPFLNQNHMSDIFVKDTTLGTLCIYFINDINRPQSLEYIVSHDYKDFASSLLFMKCDLQKDLTYYDRYQIIEYLQYLQYLNPDQNRLKEEIQRLENIYKN